MCCRQKLKKKTLISERHSGKGENVILHSLVIKSIFAKLNFEKVLKKVRESEW